MATSFIGPSVLRAWPAAPDPRPPHPIKAILSVSLLAAKALRSMDKPPRTDVPATAAEVFFRNWRRERFPCGEESGVWFCISFLQLNISDRFVQVLQTLGQLHEFLLKVWRSRNTGVAGPKDTNSIPFRPAGPIPLHLRGRRHLQWPNESKTDKRGIGKIPDAFRQLRIGHLPRTL